MLAQGLYGGLETLHGFVAAGQGTPDGVAQFLRPVHQPLGALQFQPQRGEFMAQRIVQLAGDARTLLQRRVLELQAVILLQLAQGAAQLGLFLIPAERELESGEGEPSLREQQHQHGDQGLQVRDAPHRPTARPPTARPSAH